MLTFTGFYFCSSTVALPRKLGKNDGRAHEVGGDVLKGVASHKYSSLAYLYHASLEPHGPIHLEDPC